MALFRGEATFSNSIPPRTVTFQVHDQGKAIVHAVVYHWYDHEGTERSTIHSLHRRLEGARIELAQVAYSDFGLNLEDGADRFSLPLNSDENGFYDIEEQEVFE